MWSAYSTTKLLFLILLLVEASSGRYIPNWFPYGHVAIRWDIMNKTRGSYSANVTIINYMKNRDIERPWELGWIWTEDEILLSSLGVIGTQHGNSVIAVDLPPQGNKIVPKCCKGGVNSSWFNEADLAESSTSFQITVGRPGIGYLWPPAYVYLSSPRSEYICYSPMEATKTRGYLNTWRTNCGLYNPGIKVPQEDLRDYEVVGVL